MLTLPGTDFTSRWCSVDLIVAALIVIAALVVSGLVAAVLIWAAIKLSQ
jgi:hypothetical protein